MLSKLLVFTALAFELVGLIWNLIVSVQAQDLGGFFTASHWPVYLGLVLLLVAVIQAWPKKKEKLPQVPKEEIKL